MQRPYESLMPDLGFRLSINSLYRFLFCKHAAEVLRRMGTNVVGVSLGFLGVLSRGESEGRPLLPQAIQVSFQYLVK